MGNTERSASKIIKFGTALVLGTSACTPLLEKPTSLAFEPSKEVSSTPISTGTSTPWPTVTYTLSPTPTEIPTPTPDIPALDNANQLKLEQALAGEQVELNHPLITSVWKFPWEGGQAIIAFVWGKNRPSAIVTSADCIYDNFREKNQLGNEILPFPTVWETNQRTHSLQAQVSSVPSPIPIINVEEIETIENADVETKNCQVVTAKQRLQELLSKIDWVDIPTDLGKISGKGVKAVLEFWSTLQAEVWSTPFP